MSKKEGKKRKYSETHPWIDFRLNMNAFDHQLWMLLGEARSKCEHIAGVPLRPETAEELHKVYLYKGASATTAIEGNTLSEEEARDYIEKRLVLPPSKKYLGQEIENIVNAFNLIMEWMMEGKAGELKPDNIKKFNEMVLRDLELQDSVVPGRVRSHSVQVGGYRGAPAEDCDYLLERVCEWINSTDFVLGDGFGIVVGFIKAVVVHLYIAWIHPFGDGNGRTARLVELLILLDAGVPSPAAHLLSNHYNQTRGEYYRQLAASSKSRDIVPFIRYAVRGFVDGLKEQLDRVRAQTMRVSWESYIHDVFKDRGGAAQERRRCLVLDLSGQAEPVPVTRIKLLTPRLAEFYAKKNQKVIYNDLKELVALGLLRQIDGGYLANTGIILAFLPFRKK